MLTGTQPWADLTEPGRVLGDFLGSKLDFASPPLPADTPVGVRELLARCLGDRAARPKAINVAAGLLQAAQDLSAGVFDIFLSHAWAPTGRHEAFTTEVYNRLLEAGLRVWIDKLEMGHDLNASMQKGIASSRCVVALLSSRYEGSRNCKREMAWAKEQGKNIIVCLADPSLTWFPTPAMEIYRILGGMGKLMPDLRPAAGVNWAPADGSEVSPAQRSLLTKVPEALPLVIKLVRESGGAVAAAAVSGCW